MRYADDVARLARAVAALTAAGPPTGILHGAERQAVLVSRDAVATELRDLTRVVPGIAPQPGRLDLELMTVNPARALHARLANLPIVADNGTSLTDALAVGGGPLTGSWHTSPAATVALEQYHDVLITVAGEDARAVVRDVAEVAAALPYLDADLAAALPADDPARDQLLEPTWHGLVRLAAIEVQAQTADLPPDTAHVQLPVRPRAIPVRTVAELPAANWQLTGLISVRGAELTAVEARAVARVLAAGVELTARVLANPAITGRGPAAAWHLSAAVPQLHPGGRPAACNTDRPLPCRPLPRPAAPRTAIRSQRPRRPPSTRTALTRTGCRPRPAAKPLGSRSMIHADHPLPVAAQAASPRRCVAPLRRQDR